MKLLQLQFITIFYSIPTQLEFDIFKSIQYLYNIHTQMIGAKVEEIQGYCYLSCCFQSEMEEEKTAEDYCSFHQLHPILHHPREEEEVR